MILKGEKRYQFRFANSKKLSADNVRCELEGCMYNEDGYCAYENSPVQVSYVRVCEEDEMRFYGKGDAE